MTANPVSCLRFSKIKSFLHKTVAFSYYLAKNGIELHSLDVPLGI